MRNFLSTPQSSLKQSTYLARQQRLTYSSELRAWASYNWDPSSHRPSNKGFLTPYSGHARSPPRTARLRGFLASAWLAWTGHIWSGCPSSDPITPKPGVLCVHLGRSLAEPCVASLPRMKGGCSASRFGMGCARDIQGLRTSCLRVPRDSCAAYRQPQLLKVHRHYCAYRSSSVLAQFM